MAQKTTRELGRLFDAGAEEYDLNRPGYPVSLVETALRRGELRAGSRVLEIGCGTGKLTEQLAARGLIVDAVDPGPNLIDVARRRVGESGAVTFHQGRFEDVDLGDVAFDAAFSATAFHWVEPKVGWRRVADHLRAGGLLALLQYVDVRDGRATAEHEGFMELLRRYAPDVADEWREAIPFEELLAGARERYGNASEVWDWLLQGGLQLPSLAVAEAASLFEAVEVTAETAEVEKTADELVAILRTTSLYRRIDPARRDAFAADERRLIERLGGSIRSTLAMLLMTARRTAS